MERERERESNGRFQLTECTLPLPTARLFGTLFVRASPHFTPFHASGSCCSSQPQTAPKLRFVNLLFLIW